MHVLQSITNKLKKLHILVILPRTSTSPDAAISIPLFPPLCIAAPAAKCLISCHLILSHIQFRINSSAPSDAKKVRNHPYSCDARTCKVLAGVCVWMPVCIFVCEVISWSFCQDSVTKNGGGRREKIGVEGWSRASDSLFLNISHYSAQLQGYVHTYPTHLRLFITCKMSASSSSRQNTAFTLG